MNNYDVIIVGAGNGGLATAATLTKKGFKTLIIERNVVPGGSATSYRRGRFEFEAALHELCNVGYEENPGSIRRLFDSWGVKINWIIDETLFRTIAKGEDGYDVIMPSGVENYCNAMEKAVPGSYESVKVMFEYITKINKAMAYLSSGKVDPKVLATEHADFLRMASHSVDEVLEALNMPKKAQSIVKTYWPYLGTPTYEIDFAHYAMMFERYVIHKAALPKYRSHELSLAIVDMIKKNGSDVWFNSEVEEILVENGKAYGVVVNGERLYAKHIVANCSPDTVYAKLIKNYELPVKANKLSNARKSSSLFFMVSLGLNRSIEELGIKDYSVFLYDSPNTTKQFESCERAYDSFIIANCLNAAVEDASPSGTSILSFTSIMTEEAWKDIKPEEYNDVKNFIAERMIKKYEEFTGIIISPYIEEIVIAAPPTFARYLATPNGTPYGYRLQSFDTMINRIMNLKNELFIKNLHFVGAYAERALGYSSVYANGESVALRIIKEEMKNEQ
jgi:prolycopene isomerase